ncbi:DUF4355 domain-containing protein [Rossellomorea vietnamensis]|uniref:DUF4355 domain-containing protein n=1 Tax=Rossellomorea vietnamensis TaxID=218284 RepID=A0A5D4M3W7_9BACI|nr:DUF4355 domain-containing protein [Rossellomorea vietnamensis]TYR95745.1 DUF4355 domain-containing protein [Rossellomorea vietnamensis]
MTIEQLKQMLENGEITQAEFDKKVAEITDNKDKDKEKDQEIDLEKLMADEKFQEQINKMIQSSNDKIRTEYSQKLKDITDKYDTLKTEKMTDEEKLSLKQQEFEEQQRAFEKQRLNFEFVNHLSDQKLPTKLNDFVPGSDLEKKKENLEGLMAIVNEFVEVKVQEKFGSQRHDFEPGGDKKVDFKTMSIDEKIKLAEEDFELYSKLKAQAGL